MLLNVRRMTRIEWFLFYFSYFAYLLYIRSPFWYFGIFKSCSIIVDRRLVLALCNKLKLKRLFRALRFISFSICEFVPALR